MGPEDEHSSPAPVFGFAVSAVFAIAFGLFVAAMFRGG